MSKTLQRFSPTLRAILSRQVTQRPINTFQQIRRRLLTTKTTQTTSQLNHSHQQRITSKLVFTEYGDPIEVVRQINAEPLAPPAPNECLVRILAAPVNPADINTIQGRYAVKPSLPAVAGNEGVGIIETIPTDGTAGDFRPGDRVILIGEAAGSWRTRICVPPAELLRIPTELTLAKAATITVNPCTAYRMLRDFVLLRPGDTVLQNGANSACGQSVIQLCRTWGVRTINVVRDRPNIDDLKCFLYGLGATHVLTESEIRTTDIFKRSYEDDDFIARPKLFLNCVGGKNAVDCMRHVERGATVVTYGGMSREPVTVSTSALIFKEIQVRGFWMTGWTRRNIDAPERQEMFNELISLLLADELQAPVHELVPFGDYKRALANTMNAKGMVGKKFILDMNDAV